jgi:hypothetical protein
MRLLLIPAAVVCLQAGCSSDAGVCTAEYEYGLAVRVVSSSTRALICDATVTASEGAYRERLKLIPGPDGPDECVYYGGGERAGTYAIDVVAGTTERTIADIAVTHDECHVLQRQLTVEL